MTKVVLFDLDGTLVDAREWHYEALNDALNIFGYKISREEHIKKFDGLSTRKKLELLTVDQDLPKALHDILFEIKQERTLRRIAKDCYPITSVLVTLTRLSALRIKIGLVTNSVKVTTAHMLKFSGIEKYFDLVITNEDVSKPKPHPEGYLKALEFFGVKAQDAVVVEDGEYGIKAAKDAGIFKILKVNSPLQVTFDRVVEIAGLLATPGVDN